MSSVIIINILEKYLKNKVKTFHYQYINHQDRSLLFILKFNKFNAYVEYWFDDHLICLNIFQNKTLKEASVGNIYSITRSILKYYKNIN